VHHQEEFLLLGQVKLVSPDHSVVFAAFCLRAVLLVVQLQEAAVAMHG
jgi:hypothetical protein